jgi:large subunit ribosomal protein L22
MVDKVKQEKVSVKAIDRAIRCSARKLNIVAASIRGMNAGRALNELTFSKRRVAGDVKKVLMSAIANAENNHNLDVDRLYVAEAYVGKAMVMKRFKPMAKGRAGRVIKPFSNLTIVVCEHEEKA